MAVLRRWASATAVLSLLLLLAVGCGSPLNQRVAEEAATASEAEEEAAAEDFDDLAAPAERGGGDDADGRGVPGSPLTIPAVVQDQGRPLDEVSREIESGLRDQCGGELCVTLRVEQRDEPCCTACQFVKTEPAQRSQVNRGETVVIVSGAAPCSSEPVPGAVEDPGAPGQVPSEPQPTS